MNGFQLVFPIILFLMLYIGMEHSMERASVTETYHRIVRIPTADVPPVNTVL